MSGGLLIGLAGRAGAGKSTVSFHLEDKHDFEPVAFAAPIQAMIFALFNESGIDGAWCVERELKELPSAIGPSYRELAQTLGTEWGRQLMGKEFWLRIALRKLQLARQHEADVVISDVRFANEAEWLRAQGGVLVRIDRRNASAVRDHASEREGDTIAADHVIDNNGSLAVLHDQIDDLVERLRQRLAVRA